MDSSSGDDYNKKKASADERAGDLFDAYETRKANKDNIAAIRDRKGRNEPVRPQNDDVTQSGSYSSSHGEKEELEKKDKLDPKDTLEKEDKSSSNSSGSKGLAQNAVNKALGVNNLKNKWLALQLKLKLIGIVACAVFGLLLILMLYNAITSSFEVFTNAITNFFGISENNIAGEDGLYTSTKYYYDEDGNELNHKTLVEELKKGKFGCSYSKVNNLIDWFTGPDFDGDVCKFLRYIKNHTHIKVGDSETDVDSALIISSIFYGFDTQPLTSQYKDPNNVKEEYVDSNEHFDTLVNILSDKNTNINKSMLDKIIENSYVTMKQTYYVWEVEVDEDTGDKTGKCVPKTSTKVEYSLEKWKIFMRFGEGAAQEYDDSLDNAYLKDASSEECNGSMSESELMNIVNTASDSNGNPATGEAHLDISAAQNAMNSSNNSKNFSCAANIESKTKDDCGEFDYKNGFAYNHFAGYKVSEEDPNIEIEYDDIFTPKKVETTIQDIIGKKKTINDVLLIDDPDTEDYSPSDQVGSVVTNAYCKDYVKTSYDVMKVKLTDCHGVYLDTVTFEDYIIGVANAEVSNKNDNYVLSEMLAAISYALRRRENYTKGETIVMKSGTCDQAYCSPKLGCTVKNNPEICKGCMSFYIGGGRGKNAKLYNKYKELFSIASQFLVVSKGKVHNAHYVSTIQNQWYKKATQGLHFTQIIQETYEKEGAKVIKCSNGQVPEKEEIKPSDKIGASPTSEYPNFAPDIGKFYGYSYATGSNNNITINPLWVKENIVTLSPTCSNEEFANMEFRVNKAAISNFNKAFKNICTLLTDGVRLQNGTVCKLTMNNLTGGTVFVEKISPNGFEDLHTYGIAQDWNYTAKYSVNGQTYSPYSSNATLETYWDFVEALNKESGNSDLYNEENCKNINYILYKYAYEPAGFEWGFSQLDKYNDGNFVTGSFNGKTFVITN